MLLPSSMSTLVLLVLAVLLTEQRVVSILRGTTAGDGGGSSLGDDEENEFWARFLEEGSLLPTAAPVASSTPAPVLAPSTPGPVEPTTATLELESISPGGAFVNQEIDFKYTVTNVGAVEAMAVTFVAELPSEGSFVSSNPQWSIGGMNTLMISLDSLDAGESISVTVLWLAPGDEAVLETSVSVVSSNAETVTVTETVQVGAVTVVSGGVTSAGVALRNRDSGVIDISGIPDGAVVTRAVLVWAVLFSGPEPSNQITLNANNVRADLTTTISSDVCWFEDSTVGFAADVNQSSDQQWLIRADECHQWSHPRGFQPY